MNHSNPHLQFMMLATWAGVGWFGMFVHNMVDLPNLTLLSLENSLPALVSAVLVIGWWFLPWKRAVTTTLLGWALLHLIGGGVLSVLPLPIWPYVPAQTRLHYLMHVVYGLAQLPLIWLLVRWFQRGSVRIEL